MSTLKPDDLAHLPSLEFALPMVASAHPDGATYTLALYRAVTDALQDAGRPTLPLGSFNRLVIAAGFTRKSYRYGGRRQSPYFQGLNLLDEASEAP